MPVLDNLRNAILASAASLMQPDDGVDELIADEAFLRLAAAWDAIDRGIHPYGSRGAASEAQTRLVEAIDQNAEKTATS
jgi:hypothetical protein